MPSDMAPFFFILSALSVALPFYWEGKRAFLKFSPTNFEVKSSCLSQEAEDALWLEKKGAKCRKFAQQ